MQVESFKKVGDTMKNPLKTLPLLAFGLLLTASLARAQLATATGTTTVTVTIGPEAGFDITNSTTPLTATGSNFNQFTGSTAMTYLCAPPSRAEAAALP